MLKPGTGKTPRAYLWAYSPGVFSGSTAKLNGHDPHAYLRDVLRRLPTHGARQIGELLPHRWVSATA